MGDGSKLKNFKFELQIDGMAPIKFNEITAPHKASEGIRTFKSGGFSDVTFEREISPADTDFYEWTQEVMDQQQGVEAVEQACGRGGMDVKLKDRYGRDIDFQVWRTWVPGLLVLLLRTWVLRWLFNWKQKWFLKSRTTFKNAYPIRYEPVPEESDSDVSVSELTMRFK
jgi:hypothetical protein